MKRSTRERFTFTTPDYLIEAARAICVEVDREYPYLAQFHHENDGRYTLFSLHTVKRSISRHYGEMIGNSGWDVDWISGYGRYAYHQSSGGGSLRQTISGVYWRHPAMLHCIREETARYVEKSFRKRNRTRRLRRIPSEILKGYGGQYDDLMAMLEYTGIDAGTYYCSVCKEHLPDREEHYCEHVWWCDDGLLRGPGAEEINPCQDEDCFYCARQLERTAA